jgi:hypothetical protein
LSVRNQKSVFVVSLGGDGKSAQIPVSCAQLAFSFQTLPQWQLEKSGDFFWLARNTLAQVIESDAGSDIYAYQIAFSSEPNGSNKSCSTPVLIGSIPSKSARNFRYNPTTGNLVFSAEVYPDGNLTTVAEQDKEWEGRGNSAYVYDTTYVRHWDVWQGKKGPQLFSVKISQGLDGLWKTSEGFNNPLQGTKHVCVLFFIFTDIYISHPSVFPS